MNNELLNTMKIDMKIDSYFEESDERYAGRIVYSAICHWMRYTIFDEIKGEYNSKSKKYILERGKDLLKLYLECVPECRYWLCTGSENNELVLEDVIRLIRERMLVSGEFLEVDVYGNIGLPQYEPIMTIGEYSRVVGLSANEKERVQHVGVTRIIKNIHSNQIPNLKETLSPIKMIDWFKENSVWMECNSLDHFEFFNPTSRNAPYKSWESIPKSGLNIHLARVTNYNEQKEYYLFKRDETKWMNCLLPTVYTEYKETRRLILGLREMCNNPMMANYYVRENVILLNLFCRLPHREEHILETYCWPLKSITDRVNYVVPIQIWDAIKDLLQNDLRIVLKEKL